MKRTAAEKIIKKRTVLVERTANALQISETEAQQLLQTERCQSVRLNPLKAKPAETLQAIQALGWKGEKYGWCENAYTIDEGAQALRDSQLTADGALLIQNAASWLSVLALDARAGDTILDVCAAPGGKTSHIAAVTGNRAVITANDNSRARLAKLQAMCGKLNASIERYTLFDATQLARKLDGERYDKILIDAPCSGEGMMRLDRDKDFASWSVAHIKRLQQLQKRILTQAWQLLEPGGTLVYSTCTMTPEENEAVIDYGLRALEGASIVPLDLDLPNRVPTVGEWNGKSYNPALQGCLRLKPSRDIEAFFVCKLVKSDSPSESTALPSFH